MALPVQTEKSVATSTVSPSQESYDSEPGKPPSLLTVCLLVQIPVVKAAIQKSQSTWRILKEGNVVAKWTLNAVEVAVSIAAKPGRMLGWFFKTPIGIADRAISGRIIETERKWPILKESPGKVVEVTVETARGRLWCWYATSGAVAADGKRAVAAAADLACRLLSAAHTWLQQSLTNFEDLVDEIAASSAGDPRIVEGQSHTSSEVSAQCGERWAGRGMLQRVLQSVVYLCVGCALRALSAAPGRVGRLGSMLRALRPQPGPKDSRHGSSRASPTPTLEPSSSSSASSQSQPADE